MPSFKTILLGGIAIGGVAVAGYITYRWFTQTEPKVLKFAGQINCDTMDKIIELKKRARAKAIFDPTNVAFASHRDRVISKADLPRDDTDKLQPEVDEEDSTRSTTAEDIASTADVAETGSISSHELHVEDVIKEEPSSGSAVDLTTNKAEAETLRGESPETTLEQDYQVNQTTAIQIPTILQGMTTMREFEQTFEALAAYLLRQDRSEDELREVQRELGWWWNVVVAFQDRLPKNVPDFENMLPLENEDGMQSVG